MEFVAGASIYMLAYMGSASRGGFPIENGVYGRHFQEYQGIRVLYDDRSYTSHLGKMS